MLLSKESKLCWIPFHLYTLAIDPTKRRTEKTVRASCPRQMLSDGASQEGKAQSHADSVQNRSSENLSELSRNMETKFTENPSDEYWSTRLVQQACDRHRAGGARGRGHFRGRRRFRCMLATTLRRSAPQGGLSLERPLAAMSQATHSPSAP